MQRPSYGNVTVTLNAFSMPSHLPPVTGQVTDLQRQVGFPEAAWSGNNRNAELPYSWRALLSSLLQGVPIPSQLTPAVAAHSGQTVDKVSGGRQERLGPYHCSVEGDDQCLG